VTVGAIATMALATPAAAEIEPGNIPAEDIATAYPTQPSTWYYGAFQPDTATYHDLDYLAFTVASAGETVQFSLQNTTAAVDPNAYEWCPVYLSILDGSDTLVADGAGTIATYGDTEVFDWTFPTAGTYYMVMESNGDMPAGDPTYAVSYALVSGGGPGSSPPGSSPPGSSPPGSSPPGSSPPGSSPPLLVSSLLVPGRQHGHAVHATIVLAQAAEVRAVLKRDGKVIAAARRTRLAPGTHRLALRVPSAYSRRRRLSVVLQISVGAASYTRLVTLIL
jgi:hypothetical protein